MCVCVRFPISLYRCRRRRCAGAAARSTVTNIIIYPPLPPRLPPVEVENYFPPKCVTATSEKSSTLLLLPLLLLLLLLLVIIMIVQQYSRYSSATVGPSTYLVRREDEKGQMSKLQRATLSICLEHSTLVVFLSTSTVVYYFFINISTGIIIRKLLQVLKIIILIFIKNGCENYHTPLFQLFIV